jgi:hypothetical protein
MSDTAAASVFSQNHGNLIFRQLIDQFVQLVAFRGQGFSVRRDPDKIAPG